MQLLHGIEASQRDRALGACVIYKTEDRETYAEQKLEKVYSQIKELLHQARQHAYSQVNFTMVQGYWNVGRIIVEDKQVGENRAEYVERF